MVELADIPSNQCSLLALKISPAFTSLATSAPLAKYRKTGGSSSSSSSSFSASLFAPAARGVGKGGKKWGGRSEEEEEEAGGMQAGRAGASPSFRVDGRGGRRRMAPFGEGEEGRGLGYPPPTHWRTYIRAVADAGIIQHARCVCVCVSERERRRDGKRSRRFLLLRGVGRDP